MLRIALCFHFNQNLNQYSYLASQVCYKGLLSVLRRHSRLPFAIHISGTLLHALQWLDPEPLQLIADGVRAGQFTILGSTYAQNVPYASDDWDNSLQLAVHRAVLQRAFGVNPSIFWNSERCWRQSLVPVLAASGYTHTLLETHVLAAAGCSEPHAVWQTGLGGHELTIFNDDPLLKDAVNYAIWTGRSARALDYLAGLAAQPGSDSFYVWYAEDAEASGLWGFGHRVLPQSAWANLDGFLTLLEQQPWLSLTAPAASPPAQGYLPALADGQAAWMVSALQRPGAPYHEDGYTDWFDFNARAPKLKYFRALYGRIRERLVAAQARPPATPAAGRLIAQAHLALATHQYEFGCVGIGRPGDRQWEMARAALVSLAAGALAAAPPTAPRIWQADINEDGVDEILLADARQFVVLDPQGGRLLYAYDLQEGVSWVGNENAMIPAPYVSDAAYPVLASPPATRWLPPTFDSSVEGYLPQQADPRRLWGRYLPVDWWDGEPAQLPVYFLPDEPSAAQPQPALLAGQVRALNDTLWLDGERLLAPEHALDWQVEVTPRRVRFEVQRGPLRFAKELSLYEGGLEVTYRVHYAGVEPATLQLEIENELCPASVDLMDAGRDAVVYWHSQGYPVETADRETGGVFNRAANYLVVLQMKPRPHTMRGAEGLLALFLTPRFEWRLAPGEDAVLGLRWRALKLESA